MHIDCTGSGSPAIVLDAGLGNDALAWSAVQPELSKNTRVCSYDRAGFGWSDALSGPRDADHIAAELHDLLREAGVTGSIVLMGHSIAGVYMRDFATRYPGDLAGIVFVDGATPLPDRYLTPAMKAATPRRPPQWITMSLVKFAFRAGIPRLFGVCSQPMKGLDARTAKLLAEDMCHTNVGAVAAELESIDRSGEETIHTGPYGALPILILSHDPAKALSGKPPQQMVDMENQWSKVQEDFKSLSTHSRRIIARDSGHAIQIDRADLIEKEVPLFIQQIRGTAPQPTNYGSTLTE
jgi:pimeloyl-ACP methyl ester carboxylesterase